MNTHADIVEPDRIASILADSANFVWRAIDCEYLGDWAPDLGLSNYDRPSIFRNGRNSQSGGSTLCHRFWGTIKHQCDHRGQRHAGVVMYVDHAAPMTFKLQNQVLGSIAPQHIDNRVHLLVLPTPTEFIGEMERFFFNADGSGQYRIEHFVLLSELPTSSSFAPELEHLECRRKNGRDSIHFITSRPARCTVRLGEGEAVVEDEAHRLHAIELPPLPDGEYTASISATTPQEVSCSVDTQLTIGGTTSNQSKPLTVPIQLWATDGSAQPATFGLPLPQGKSFAPSSCTIEVNGQRCPAQVRTLSEWPDKSTRWALVDGQLPGSQSDVPRDAHVHFNDSHEAPIGLHCEVDGDTVTVTGKGLTLRVSQAENLLQITCEDRIVAIPATELVDAELGNGLRLSASAFRAVTLEENGPLRAVVRAVLTVADSDGIGHFESQLRFHVYANQTYIKLVHRLLVISPILASIRGDLPDDPRFAHAQDAVFGREGEEQTLLTVNHYRLRIPWPGCQQLTNDDLTLDISDASAAIIHEQDVEYRVYTAAETAITPGRRSGHFVVTGTDGALAVGIRHFWQTWPKGVDADGSGVWIDILPTLSGDPLPGDENAWHRLYFWLRDGKTVLKAGMALTNELILGLPTDDEDIADAFAWLDQPPIARPAPAYTASTEALQPIGVKSESPIAKYESLADAALDSYQQEREHFRAYGHLNYGDWYGESGWSWGNNEYDPTYCGYIEFLRGGDPGWAKWGADAARHLVDIDTCNWSPDPQFVGMQAAHMVGHIGGYLPRFFRCKIGDTIGMPCHHWVEGPMLHYLLTGDETVRETLEHTRSWLLAPSFLDHYEYSNARIAGWHIIHLCMYAAAANDPEALNAARIIVQRVLEKEKPGGGWEHLLTEGHCGCGFPRCSGEAGLMVGVLLSALARYHHLTQDPAVARAIIGGARWLIAETFDEASGYFRYTCCPKRDPDGGVEYTHLVIEGLAAAYSLSHDPDIGRHAKCALRSVGEMSPELAHLGLGKAMSIQMRCVPTALAILQEHPV